MASERGNSINDLGVANGLLERYGFIKCDKLVRFVFRATRNFKSPRGIAYLYVTLVQSVLENASMIWSLYYATHNRNNLKSKRFKKYIISLWNESKVLE